MGPIAGPMMIATAVTAVRVVARPDREARQLARVVIGGTLATGALLGLGIAAPAFAAGFAMLVMVTALLVHGVALASLAQSAIS
jgi:uncharacterized membrane protein YphA (DoxX/SURF4 family)